jgi:hypothetical protein
VGSVTINVTGDNVPPVAANDTAETNSGTAVTINVLQNDSDADGQLVPQSVTISQSPTSGTATVNTEGNIVYTPNSGFVGTDSLRYTVRDDNNDPSNVAVVTIDVNPIGPPWQNAVNRFDVNNDGAMSPIDALQVINELNARGPRRLDPPPLPGPPFSPPPFLDVSGDNFLSPIDALQVINILNELAGARPPVAAVADLGAAVADLGGTEQIIGAALSIQPRTRYSRRDVDAVDRVYFDGNVRGGTSAGPRRIRGTSDFWPIPLPRTVVEKSFEELPEPSEDIATFDLASSLEPVFETFVESDLLTAMAEDLDQQQRR